MRKKDNQKKVANDSLFSNMHNPQFTEHIDT